MSGCLRIEGVSGKDVALTTPRLYSAPVPPEKHVQVRKQPLLGIAHERQALTRIRKRVHVAMLSKTCQFLFAS